MRLLIVQHDRHEHAGRFRALLARDRIHTRTLVAPETGPDAWPEAGDFDALWVLGGVMQVWETDRHPWLTPEVAFIRRTVTDWAKPYFGICFGHQLLAQALGGSVGPAGATEFGVRQVWRHAGETPLLHGLSAGFDAFEWHSAEVVQAPPGLTVAAANPACANQVMTGPGAVGSVQFHPEIDVETMRGWMSAPGCIETLESMQGQGADTRLLRDLERAEPDLAHLAGRLYDNWMGLARAQLS
jgi:GMP synthase-like glutamine amidotransferase